MKITNFQNLKQHKLYYTKEGWWKYRGIFIRILFFNTLQWLMSLSLRI